MRSIFKVAYSKGDPWVAELPCITLGEIRSQLKEMKNLDQYLRVLGMFFIIVTEQILTFKKTKV